MTTFRAVALDVDGTLVDSEPLHLQALQAACWAHDVDISDQGPLPFVGVSISDVWRSLAPRFVRTLGHHDDRGEHEFRTAVSKHYLAHAHEVQALPGARIAIEHLARQGVALAAVSNSERAIVKANLRAVGARATFGAVVSLDDVRRPKPAPDPYLQAMRLLGVNARETLVVEDSPSGARSARAAGLRVLVVGADPEALGDHRIEGLHEFVPWWTATQALAERKSQDAQPGLTSLLLEGASE
jgi:HAD superfamily hydrolase (TIGR01509 family)